jgi:hypothetical protein
MQYGFWMDIEHQSADFLAAISNPTEFKRDDNNISFPAFYNGLRLDPMVS